MAGHAVLVHERQPGGGREGCAGGRLSCFQRDDEGAGRHDTRHADRSRRPAGAACAHAGNDTRRVRQRRVVNELECSGFRARTLSPVSATSSTRVSPWVQDECRRESRMVTRLFVIHGMGVFDDTWVEPVEQQLAEIYASYESLSSVAQDQPVHHSSDPVRRHTQQAS